MLSGSQAGTASSAEALCCAVPALWIEGSWTMCCGCWQKRQGWLFVCVGGQNEYVWQAWAMLESRCGKIAQARKLFDAALVANRKHAAAWHGWGHMEKRQGNLLKAKDIWMKVRAVPLLSSLLRCALQGQGWPRDAERRFLARQESL